MFTLPSIRAAQRPMILSLWMVVGLFPPATARLGATPFDQSLRQIARDQGGSASNTMDYFTPVTAMSQLLKDSDYIVHAKVVSTNTVLTFEERLVATVRVPARGGKSVSRSH